MTVVAYRAGVLAADTAIWRGTLLAGHRTKFVAGPKGELAAAAGSTADARRFEGWVQSGRKRKFRAEWEPFDALLVLACGSIQRVACDGTLFEVDAEWAAIGSGAEIAIGALAAGADAAQAVAIAIDHHAQCGGRVETIRLPGAAAAASCS
jgi:ATP-dependent HslUV protease subunit HslV